MKAPLRDGRIELVPLIDVIFVLMVFFMLAAIKPPPEVSEATVKVMVDDAGAGSLALADAVVQLHDEPALDQLGIVFCTVPAGQDADLPSFEQEIDGFKARVRSLTGAGPGQRPGPGLASLFAPGGGGYPHIRFLQGNLPPSDARLLENRAVVLRTGADASVQDVLRIIHQIEDARVADLVVSPKTLDLFPDDVAFAVGTHVKRSTEGR